MRIALIMLFSVAAAGSGGRRWDRLKERLRPRLEREQPALGGEAVAAGITAQMRRGDDAVAGNDDRDGIAAVRLAN
jgi:hypothetical protein